MSTVCGKCLYNAIGQSLAFSIKDEHNNSVANWLKMESRAVHDNKLAYQHGFHGALLFHCSNFIVLFFLYFGIAIERSRWLYFDLWSILILWMFKQYGYKHISMVHLFCWSFWLCCTVSRMNMAFIDLSKFIRLFSSQTYSRSCITTTHLHIGWSFESIWIC